MDQTKNPPIGIPVFIPDEDAKQFLEFQKHYVVVTPLLRTMNTLRIQELKNMNVSMDVNGRGFVEHVAITAHFRY